MNILRDSVFSLAGGRRTSLPGVFAAMSGDQAYPLSSALRPHQRPAWHMFLVQLAALALWREPLQDPPTDEESWRTALRSLTSEFPDDSPWELVVDDWKRPAFLQPPVPEGLKWTEVETADALDMLITARNHDLKSAIARECSFEDWVYALISLQTCEGYNGKGNHGIARMNGGSSSRPMLGLAPAREGDLSINLSAWWIRDVKRLIAVRRRASPPDSLKPPLLWCLDWPENHQLAWTDLDPLCIEVCRRIRFSLADGDLTAQRSTSKRSRIDAKMLKGNTGDPWTPVQKKDGKSLTLGSGSFNYRRLYDLLFSGEWERPLLSRHGDDDIGPMVLIAEAFSRGNSKTEGFQARIVPVPRNLALFLAPDTPAARLAKAQIEEIQGVEQALRNGLALMAARGDAIKKEHYAWAKPATAQLERSADRLFFPSLWHRVRAYSDGDLARSQAKQAFVQELISVAERILLTALPAIPCPTVWRHRAAARAVRRFHNQVRRTFPECFGDQE